MKKTLLTLGGIASVATPIIAVVSCGSSDSNTAAPIYSEYNMKSIYDMKDADKATLNGLLTNANKEKTFNDFKLLVDGANMEDASKTLTNKVMYHYQNAVTHKITKGYHVLKFAIASFLQDFNMAGPAWNSTKYPVQSGKQLSDLFKDYIAKGTLDISKMAQDIISKFSLKDDHFTPVVAAVIKADSAHKKLFIPTPDPTSDPDGTMASQMSLLKGIAMNAMGGEETFKYIIENGSDWTYDAGTPATTTSA